MSSCIRLHNMVLQAGSHLQSCLQSGDTCSAEGASTVLISTAVSLADTQEQHTCRESRRQRQGAVDTDVWSRDREGSGGRGNKDGSHSSALEKLVAGKVPGSERIRTRKQESISPVMRILMSLVSSLFLHSSTPVTVAGFCWDEEEPAVDRADGRTGKDKYQSF